MAGGDAAPAARLTAWAPLANRIFRLLWIAQFGSNVGSWTQTVGAQWLLVGRGAILVTLVQVASGVPVLLFALPAGVLADLVDRRRLLLAAQVAMAALAGVLAALALAGHLPPAALLAFTFLLGCAAALSAPAWQAIQPSLVPRTQLAQASALGAVNMNTARAVGPAVGGVLVSLAGPGWTFTLNAVSFLGIALVLLRWRPDPSAPHDDQERENVHAALRAGGRYVRHSPRIRRVLIRAALFTPGTAALWALLPIVASQRLGLGSSGYGFLLGAVGVGAVTGAVLLPKAGGLLSGDHLLAGSAAVFAVALIVSATVDSTATVAAVLVFSGIAWIGALSTLNAAMQLTLPGWVRARGLAFYLVVFQGGQALGSLLWGLVADWTSLRTALLGAAGLLLASATIIWCRRRRDAVVSDPSPTSAWPEPTLAIEPTPSDGPVLIVVDYAVDAENSEAFRAAMLHVERSRRRTGATTWGLYQDAEQTSHFLETFTVASWSEHLAQHHSRYTGLDREFETRARGLVTEPPRVTHAITPGPPPPLIRADLTQQRKS
ncbi:putative MFS family arabinose efflux permease [Streptacidiphilus sp. MAP12-16]|uniref:MFS transporter n=1 Tax=Streptacidiphilus sp. MAP12-16 TaxID=3156300 RepID=UPI0035120D4B